MFHSESQKAIAIICITLMQIFMAVKSFPLADKITRLPGQPSVSFRQFSGYISVDEEQERALFYYLVEAETNPHSKPLVLWLTGGPACSSLGVGAFTEHGPFKTNGVDLIKNDYSWNKEANMLYLESPAGVGFSYSANKTFYLNVNDEITARDNLIFLRRWFSKFPEYKNRDLFIAGESYAGHYVPQFAQLIIDSNEKFNLKGIAIGNPVLEFNTDNNAIGEYLWSHGLISDSTNKLLTSVCNFSRILREALIEGGPVSADCKRVGKQALEEINYNFLDLEYVTGNFCISTINVSTRKFLYQALGALYQEAGANKYEDCLDKKAPKYLNRKDVQNSLHARLVGVTEWDTCSSVVNYDPRDQEIPTIGVVGSLLRHGIRTLVYSGDQDGVLPFISTRSLTEGLAKELGLKTTIPYRAWFESAQIGGWKQEYGHILTFATIRGASHAPPSIQPERSLLLFKSFLYGKPLPMKP
ncbi:hypothetical protein UlMin_006393 [Ulmus minor]